MKYEPPKLKLSELIASLSSVQERYGDVEVYLQGKSFEPDHPCYTPEQCWFMDGDMFILSNGSNLE